VSSAVARWRRSVDVRRGSCCRTDHRVARDLRDAFVNA